MMLLEELIDLLRGLPLTAPVEVDYADIVKVNYDRGVVTITTDKPEVDEAD